jgi:hypothetical protein
MIAPLLLNPGLQISQERLTAHHDAAAEPQSARQHPIPAELIRRSTPYAQDSGSLYHADGLGLVLIKHLKPPLA